MSQTPIEPNNSSNSDNVSPARSLVGAAISASLAVGLYVLTSNIAEGLANTPLPATSTTAINIAVAVRTLVLGVAALGTFVFALVAFGLLALTVQTLIQGTNRTSAGT